MISLTAKNLRFLKKAFPEIPEKTLKSRIKNIAWPVWKKVKVCEVTINYACNARCLFCYNPVQGESRFGNMSFDTVARSLYEGHRDGCWIAALIGGEPTLRDDLPKIASLARKIGYECVKVCTNGLKLADHDYVRRLADSGVNMFDISIHGHTAEMHDRLVGVKGAFGKCMKAVDNVRALGKEIGTNHVVNAVNYRTFPEFFEMALCRCGMNYFNIIYTHYRGTMSRNIDLLKVPISEVAPYVMEGMMLFKREKLPVLSSVIVNFTPCIVPGFEHMTADWRLPSPEDDEPLFLSDGRALKLGRMKADQRFRPDACRECVYNDCCMGFEKEYFDLFGENEFVPLGTVPVPFQAGAGYSKSVIN